MPAPLADLLHSLGQFHSNATGVLYNISQPARADPAPNWWDIDPATLAAWQRTMGRMHTAYIMREYPSQIEYQNRPLALTAIQDTAGNTLRSVKSLTNETFQTDSFIRFVNDDLFEATPGMAYADCHLRTVEGIERNTIILDYVRGYTTGVAM